ncbi:MAG: two pore domain potassium channel family protein [Coriobacteriia bacterium]|nr:two pore domain potassium channel family protein [Coriobacteriia bacterium]
MRAAAAALAAALVALGAGTLLGLDALALPGLAEALAGALLLAAPVAVLRRIAHHSRVEAGTVLGAVCVYMLIGLVFAFVFTTIGRAGAPLFAGRADEYSDHLYFSFVTLTTTGYGDLAPLTKSGQALAVLEALIGQVFLVTFVARLVSLYGSERSRGGVR